MKIEPVNAITLKCGPLTFIRRDEARDETWGVKTPSLAGLPCFSVKNYGGKPNEVNAFSGWRVVGGGPFTDAGGWTTRDAAILGATPWLIAFYRRSAKQKKKDLEAMLAAINKWLEGDAQ